MLARLTETSAEARDAAGGPYPDAQEPVTSVLMEVEHVSQLTVTLSGAF